MIKKGIPSVDGIPFCYRLKKPDTVTNYEIIIL